jgi:AcrR family transcriptional regulator
MSTASDEKRLKVIKAAAAVFMKYGYKRVTMGDIADAAGVSRPALYLIFDKKEEIFSAVVVHFAELHLEEVNGKLPSIKAPKDKLKAIFEIWSVQNFDSISRSKETRELLESTFEFAGEAMEKSYAMLESVLASTIQLYPKSALPKGLSSNQIAHILTSSMRGFKQVAKNASELRDMVEKLLLITFGA